MFMVGSHQFENLNLLVEYYSTHEFYHGVCLKFPVNIESIADYAKEESQTALGAYMDLQKLVPNVNCFFFVIKL